METLESRLKIDPILAQSYAPIIYDLGQENDRKTVENLFADQKVQNISDDYTEQLKELFQVNNPSQIFSPDFGAKFEAYLAGLTASLPLWQQGKWAYYPWISTLVHILPDHDFQHVRTARNRYLINEEEQEKYYNATVGIAGMSVGNSVTLALVLQGGARRIKLADFDLMALSNINRIRSSIDTLGLPKVVMTARQIYLINPYAEVEIFPEGLSEATIDTFFRGEHPLDLIVDEIDNLAFKYLIREQAKKYKLPLVMAADNGDNGVIDIERYDQNPELPFFHGRLGEVTLDELKNLDKMGIGKMITKHVGPQNVTKRMQESLLAIGKTIVSWPQLGGAALLNGSVLAYAIRKILTGQPLEENRVILSLDEKFIPDFNSPAEQAKRQEVTDSFKKMFGL